MPFRLTIIPAVFQALVNDVHRDMLNMFLFVYIDDIFILSETEEEDIQHVRLVLRCLLENRLLVKAEKCEFHTTTVSILGFVVQQCQLSPDPAKIQLMAEWTAPTTRKQLQQCFGFANFNWCFIWGYSKVAAPLTRLTTTFWPFAWTKEAKAAFSQGTVHHATCFVASRPRPAGRGGGGCLRCGSRGRPIAAERHGRQAASLRLLQPAPVSHQTELWRGELRAAGTGVGTARVASLAGGGGRAIHCLDGPQKLGISAQG